MLRIKIEMCPHGDERPEAVYEIGRMYIANVGGDSKRGDYDVAVCRRGTTAVPAPINPEGSDATRTGHVFDYPRLAYNVWRLIARACLAAFPEEIPKGCKPSKTVPVLDTEVMRGLALLESCARSRDFEALGIAIQDHTDVKAACNWLAAANLEER